MKAEIFDIRTGQAVVPPSPVPIQLWTSDNRKWRITCTWDVESNLSLCITDTATGVHSYLQYARTGAKMLWVKNQHIPGYVQRAARLSLKDVLLGKVEI